MSESPGRNIRLNFRLLIGSVGFSTKSTISNHKSVNIHASLSGFPTIYDPVRLKHPNKTKNGFKICKIY